MKRRTAVFALGGAAVSGWSLLTAAPALAADDVLSIENNTKFLDDYKRSKGVITRPSGLMFRIIQNGYGKRPAQTDTVRVYYTGKLINSVIFDGTSPGLPASFKLNGGLVQGWVEALLLMREGDRWQLVIPPNLGYGVRGGGDGHDPAEPDPDLRPQAPGDHARAQERRNKDYPTRSRRQGRAAIACAAFLSAVLEADLERAPSGRRPSAHRRGAGDGGRRQRAVLDQPRLHGHRARMGRAGAWHRL